MAEMTDRERALWDAARKKVDAIFPTENLPRTTTCVLLEAKADAMREAAALVRQHPVNMDLVMIEKRAAEYGRAAKGGGDGS